MVLADNFYIQTSEPEVKQRMEELLNEKEMVCSQRCLLDGFRIQDQTIMHLSKQCYMEISKVNIRHYGFAFEGKKVLIGN